MEELRYKPIALFRLDSDTPFQDYSGYGCTGTRDSTIYTGLALTSATAYSQGFSSVKIGHFTVPNWMRNGMEQHYFSITFTAYLSTSSGTGTYTIGRASGEDSITFSGTTITYTNTYSDNSTVTFSHNFQYQQKLDVAMVYTPNKLYLYLNAELAEELDITANTKSFKATTNNFTINSNAATNYLLLNQLAFYASALSPNQIKAIYARNNRIPPFDPTPHFGGQTINVSTAARAPWIKTEFKTEADWNTGSYILTNTKDNKVYAGTVDTLTIVSDWHYTVSFHTPGGTAKTISSASLWWTGKNLDGVYVSLDGVTWTAATSGRNISLITSGMNVATTNLQIRVSFAAGFSEAYIDYLRLDVFDTNLSSTQQNGRIITYTNPVTTFDEKPENLFLDNWGSHSVAGGISIGVDGSGAPVNPRTLEIWVKPDNSSGPTLSANINAYTSVYTNGTSGFVVTPNQWTVYHFIYSAAVTTAFSFTGNFTLGKVAVYPTVLTAGQIATIIKSNLGTPVTSVPDGTGMVISETVTQPTFGGIDWIFA